LARLWSAAKNSPFVKHNAIFFLGSMGVAFFNYIYYPILGHMLAPSDFGEVQALLSLFLQGAIFLNIITYLTIHITVNSETETERDATLSSLERFTYFVSYGLLTIALITAPFLKRFLNFNEVWPFIALVAALAFSIPLAFRMSFLRGQKLFLKSSLTDGIGSFTKILLSVLFVILGWRSFGAVAGLAISQIISLYFGLMWARRAGFKGLSVHKKRIDFSALKPQLIYGIGVFVVMFCVTAMVSIDVIAVKHYFSPQTAGLYAGVSAIGRIVFYITVPFSGVLITMVSKNQTSKKNSLQFYGSIGLIAVIGCIALSMLALFPRFFISVLVGSKYLQFASLLPRLGLTLLVLSLANAMLMYHMVFKRYIVAFLSTLILAITISLIYWNHATVRLVVNDLLIGSIILLTAIVTYTVATSRRH